MILAKVKKPEPKQDDEMPSDEGSEDGEGYKAAVDEMMEALKSDNKDQFGEALKSFIELCFSDLEKEPHEEYPHDQE